MDLRFNLFVFTVIVLAVPAVSDLVFSKVDRRIDLTSQAVRITSTIKVENTGNDQISKFLLTFPDRYAKKMAYLSGTVGTGKGKATGSVTSLPIEVTDSDRIPPALTVYSVFLPKSLGKGESSTVDIFSVLTHSLQPMPEKISQADIQLFMFEDSAQYPSPYPVKFQSLTVKLPEGKLESYTKLEKTKFHGSEIKYGSYENVPPFSYTPIIIHYENNQPFTVVEELVREIEISHWGNIQVTEHYNLIHGGAHIMGEFSRLDYQAKPNLSGAYAIKDLVAKLPRSARSIYYRDEIGNISTSNIRSDSRKVELKIEPRYPLFGSWRTTFTIGYGLPLHEFLFSSQGKRFLNITFGCPADVVVVDNLIVKVVLPEGARDIAVSVPFDARRSVEKKISHLDTYGRPVMVLQMNNAVKEHNQYFQVHYKFNTLRLLREPLMLVCGFFSLFLAGITYLHTDFSICKSSDSYVAKQQQEMVQEVLQKLQNIINRCLGCHEKLEVSLRDLSRTGDAQSCKATRKTVDVMLKDLSKDLKPLLAFLQSSLQACRVLPKVEELVAKERELQEKLTAKHSMVVDGFEKKSGNWDLEKRIAPLQQKITVLQGEVGDLLDAVDDI